MSATFGRLKNWVAEVLDYADLNAEIDNILNNLGPLGVGDYSANLAQMQITTDPFPDDNPSLANSLAGEIARLRFQIKQIMGDSAQQWYSDPPVSLSEISEFTFEGGLPNSRLDFGPVQADDMIRALRPQTGANGNLVVEGGLVYYINGTQYTDPTGSVVSGFSGAPTTNNTALVNAPTLADQQRTQWLGEHGTFIPVDAVGSEITALADKVIGFKINNGTSTEYFLGQYINDPTDGPKIHKARRANFFDYQGTNWERIAFSDNDVITLCRMVWLFIGTNAVVTASYNTPTWAVTAPTSPDIGDYWFNLDTTVWFTYTPSGWLSSDSVYIGQAILDGNNVVGARTADRFRNYLDTNEIILEVNPLNTEELRQATYGARTSVYGNPFRYGFRNPTWSSANIPGGGAPAASTTYYAYIDDDGVQFLTTSAPHDRRGDLGGFYDVANPMRCFGYCTTDGSGDFVSSTLVSFSKTREANFFLTDGTAGQLLVNAGATAPVWGTDHLGVSTSSNAPTGYVGEYIESVISTPTNFPTTDTYGDLTSISLTAGDWDVIGSYFAFNNGSTTTSIIIGISTTSGNSAVGIIFGSNGLSGFPPNASQSGSASISRYRVSLSATTTLYLKYRASYTVASPQAQGIISARRMR